MDLKIMNISYSYHTKYQTIQAVKCASAVMESGMFYAIVGKSGSGKSTLLSLLAGLEPPESGNIIVDGKDLQSTDIDLYRRNQCAVVYQNYNLFSLLTVQENVVYPLLLNKVPKSQAILQAQENLGAVGLGKSFWHRLPAALSGGEQQRVAIARALAVHAKLILADEPTGNLDSENSRQIMELLLGLAHDQQRCIITVTHDMEIANLADCVYKMDSGCLMEVTK